jgi:hypothetical protein
MNIKKIIRNIGSANITVLGITLAPSEEYEILVTKWSEAAFSDELLQAILDEDIVVSNGYYDLNKTIGYKHIAHLPGTHKDALVVVPTEKPLDPDTGYLVIDIEDNVLKYFDGTKWVLLDPSSSENHNFSYRKILNPKTITIPNEQQMISYQEVCIESGGELNVEGEVIIIE